MPSINCHSFDPGAIQADCIPHENEPHMRSLVIKSDNGRQSVNICGLDATALRAIRAAIDAALPEERLVAERARREYEKERRPDDAMFNR